jgi:hypothetical protein
MSDQFAPRAFGYGRYNVGRLISRKCGAGSKSAVTNSTSAGRRHRCRRSGDMVLVALSARGQDEHRRRSTAAGFNHQVFKPVEVHALQKWLAVGKG